LTLHAELNFRYIIKQRARAGRISVKLFER
jgi:hypothetical protein